METFEHIARISRYAEQYKRGIITKVELEQKIGEEFLILLTSVEEAK